LTEKMAMSIGGKYRFSELQSKHWSHFAADAGLSLGLTLKRLRQTARILPGHARALQASTAVELANKPVIERICQLIEHRCALTLSRLS
jgi:serine/threonine-protein kinase HipA